MRFKHLKTANISLEQRCVGCGSRLMQCKTAEEPNPSCLKVYANE
jgi:hypothetical protein